MEKWNFFLLLLVPGLCFVLFCFLIHPRIILAIKDFRIAFLLVKEVESGDGRLFYISELFKR